MTRAPEQHVPAWGGRRAKALDLVKREGARKGTPCCLCRQTIDYSLPSTNPDGCSLQHFKSRPLFPQLTWSRSSWAPVHLPCNQSAGTGANDRREGVTSQEL